MHLLGKIIKKDNIFKINNNIKYDRKKFKFQGKTDRKFNIYYLLLYALISISILILMTSCKGAKEVEEPIKPTEESEVVTPEESEIEVTREAKIEKILKGEEEPLEPIFKELSGSRSKYSGVEDLSQTVKERAIAILIDNLCDPGGDCVRPQDGLADADIVIEVTDEGGITRYIAIFGADKIVNEIGPIRSSRPYFSEIAFGFDPLFAHFGASPDHGYENIDHLGILDLCASRTKLPHWRDTSRGLAWEHCAYTKTTDLRQAAKDLGYGLEGGKSPLKFKADALEDERGEEDIIIIDITRPPYQAKYVYDKETNSYTKYVGGVLHTDRKSGNQIIAKNLIIQTTDVSKPYDKYGHIVVRTTGYGDALFFMDGKVIEGYWGRTSVADPYLYLDKEGRPIGFNVGSTWISFIPSLENVSSTSL